MSNPASPLCDISLRSDLRPGDLGAVIALHGIVYAQERGWDTSFEAYVAGPLAQFALSRGPRERIWLAEQGDRLLGCVAIVAAGADTAQLRWFLVGRESRGLGLGRGLLATALEFCRQCGYCDIILWTEQSLIEAARLYLSVGFVKVEERPGERWGQRVVEEKYQLVLKR